MNTRLYLNQDVLNAANIPVLAETLRHFLFSSFVATLNQNPALVFSLLLPVVTFEIPEFNVKLSA